MLLRFEVICSFAAYDVSKRQNSIPHDSWGVIFAEKTECRCPITQVPVTLPEVRGISGPCTL